MQTQQLAVHRYVCMSRTRFEALVDAEQSNLRAKAMNLMMARDPIALAGLIGQHEGLQQAKDLMRQAIRATETEDQNR